MADSAEMTNLKAELDAAIQARDTLARRASELPTLIRQAVQSAVAIKTAIARGEGQQEDLDAAYENLRSLRNEEDLAGYEKVEARRRVYRASIAVENLKMVEANEQLPAAWELVEEARASLKHFRELERQRYNAHNDLAGRVQRAQKAEFEARQNLADLDKEERRLEERERDNQGLQPRTSGPATKGREIIFDSLR